MFHRYRSLVDDWEAFEAACARPLSRVVWANPLLADPAEVASAVLARCPQAEPLRWRVHAWRLPPDARPGSWPEYLSGWLHGQEEAALWAVDALDPRPGQRVLDLCAAPGNKAAQIAVAMGDAGCLVANERRPGRLSALRFNLERLGVTCAVVTHGDGKRYGGEQLGEQERFDRVLVDAPCSCEGTTRKSGVAVRSGRDVHREVVTQIQTALLRKAVSLTRSGGVVVYSTCTFAPEENEAVVDAVRDAVVVEPIRLPEGLVGSAGVAEWQGRRYRDDVVNAVRMWPHHNDTGGFFVARLRKL